MSEVFVDMDGGGGGMTHPRFWPQKYRDRAIDLILDGLDPWRVRAIIEIEAKRPLPRVTLWKWMRADIQEDETCTTRQ